MRPLRRPELLRRFAAALTPVALLAGAVLAVSRPADAAPANLVPNPSVEVSAGSRPAGWSVAASGTNRRTTLYMYNGAAAGHRFVRTMVTSYRSGAAGWGFSPVTVRPGTTYTYSVSSRSNVTALVTAKVTYRSGATATVRLGSIPPSDGWTSHAFTWTAPAGVRTVAVRHLLVSTGTLDVDNARLAVAVTAASNPPYSTPPTDAAPSTAPPTTPPTTPPTSQPRAGSGIVSVTFDDGLQSQYDNAFPVLTARGIPGTFYLVSGLLSGSTTMTVPEARQLQSAGEELGSHTVTHRNLTTLSPAEVTAELADSKTALEAQFGPIHALAYPYGATNDAVAAEAAKYYSSARTTDGGLNSRGAFDRYRLRMRYVVSTTDAATVAAWCQEAAASGSWLVLVYHGIDSSGYVYSTAPSMFAAHMDAVHASGLTPLTMTAALARMS